METEQASKQYIYRELQKLNVSIDRKILLGQKVPKADVELHKQLRKVINDYEQTT